jgi:hypothetical protein
MESGIKPSPHGLSIGGLFPSATITSKPRCLAAIAAASPAGPPPITKTSVLCAIGVPRTPEAHDLLAERAVVRDAMMQLKDAFTREAQFSICRHINLIYLILEKY